MKQKIEAVALRSGADLFGVASWERWKDLPSNQNPLSLMPDCRSVIAVGKRILRGTFRGVEEGTSFSSTYNMFGALWQERTFLAPAIYETAAALEAMGGEAMPLFGGFADDAPVQLDTKQLAHLAGQGIIGKGGFFLTPKYGHRQRFGLVLTTIELEADAIMDLGFCDDCDACLKACPLNALATGDDKYKLDKTLCEQCRNGKLRTFDCAYESLDRLAASCGRACLVALEDKIGNKFKAPFRKRSVWTRDLDGHCTVKPL